MDGRTHLLRRIFIAQTGAAFSLCCYAAHRVCTAAVVTLRFRARTCRRQHHLARFR